MQSLKIRVNTSKPYDVIIGEGLLRDVGRIIKDTVKSDKVLLISDDTVFSFYGEEVKTRLKEFGFTVKEYVIKAGEESKNLNVYGKILSFAAEHEITRKDVVVALGGGVVGDLSGFVAATYLRGIPYIQIPTTLLAEIDSSVGGKTAVDIKEGKNLVGAFKQPEIVIIDTLTLKTLPDIVYAEGMGEGVKYAFLSKEIFDLMQGKFSISDFVYACVKLKAEIVERDEFEKGERRLLNFGHTVAHGIEKLSGYKIAHGKAVALGIKSAIKGGVKRKIFTEEEGKALINFTEKYTKSGDIPFKMEDVLKEAVYDKKRSDEYINIACLYQVGEVKELKVKLSDLGEYFL